MLSCLCFSSNAQGILKKMSVGFRAGAIFANYDNDYAAYYSPYRSDKTNHWNLEMNIEDKKFGIGLTARYITMISGFIKNPINRQPNLIKRQIGDLSSIVQNLSGFTFFVNKRLLLINKHRLDIGLGTQMREDSYWYFNGAGQDNISDDEKLDKHGLFTRLGYSYLINKHFSVSTNIEYARFQKRPTDLLFVNILAGVCF